jgi:hypothetical protein
MARRAFRTSKSSLVRLTCRHYRLVTIVASRARVTRALERVWLVFASYAVSRSNRPNLTLLARSTLKPATTRPEIPILAIIANRTQFLNHCGGSTRMVNRLLRGVVPSDCVGVGSCDDFLAIGGLLS